MAPLLIGTAAIAATGTAAAVPATAGLFGAAGAITAGGLATGGALVGGLALGTAGILQAGAAQAAQAESAAELAAFNARVAEQEAQAIEARTGFEGRRQAEVAERRQSRLRAALSASGVVPTAGAALLIQTEQAKESELEQLLIGFEGGIAAGRARSQAALDRTQAGIFSQRAGAARTAGVIGAGGSLLQGFGRIGSLVQSQPRARAGSSFLSGVNLTRKRFP